MSQKLQKDRKLVQEVFDKVYNKYDLMNDIMSFGSHRNWKKILIQMMNPIEISAAQLFELTSTKSETLVMQHCVVCGHLTEGRSTQIPNYNC